LRPDVVAATTPSAGTVVTAVKPPVHPSAPVGGGGMKAAPDGPSITRSVLPVTPTSVDSSSASSGPVKTSALSITTSNALDMARADDEFFRDNTLRERGESRYRGQVDFIKHNTSDNNHLNNIYNIITI